MKRKRLFSAVLAKYNDRRLVAKLVIAFVLAAMIPMLLIQSLSFVLNGRTMSQKTNEIMTDQLITISKQVQLKLEVYQNVIHQIQVDSTVLGNLPDLDGDPRARANAYSRIANSLKRYHNTTQGIRSISVVRTDGDAVIYDSDTDSSIDNIWRDTGDLRETLPYRKAMEDRRMTLTPTTRFDEPGGNVSLFHISQVLYNLDQVGKGPVAVVILSVQESVLNDLCNNMDSGMSLETSINFIMDDSRNVIAYPSSFYTGFRLDDRHSVTDFVLLTGYLKDKRLAVNCYHDAGTGWDYYNVYDVNYVLRDLNRQQALFLAVGITLFGLSILLIQYTVRKINQSLKGLMGGIKQVQAGNLDIEVPVTGKDELGEIAENFNEMTCQVKESIRQVSLAAERQRIAEIRALEAQINPHFMYNTLDSINWMAIDKEEYEISRALRDFGVILRYSVSKSDELVPLWKVGDWIEKYVQLHQMRFAGVFEFAMNIDADVRDVKVHKLLLQPFVENAILHGFKGVESGGILRVDMNGSEDGKSVVILIEDNGKGMPPELVRSYNETGDNGGGPGGIGLSNVIGRLKMYYGDRAHWNITSVDGFGTIVTLIIPREEDSVENSDCGG